MGKSLPCKKGYRMQEESENHKDIKGMEEQGAAGSSCMLGIQCMMEDQNTGNQFLLG